MTLDMVLTIKELVEDGKDYNIVDSIEDFTCYNCRSYIKCPGLFDLYNTNGDCLKDWDIWRNNNENRKQ